MRALVSFSLILVAGILGTTIAQNSHEIENKKVNKIQDIQYFLIRAFNFQNFEDLPNGMENFNRLKCRLNGGPSADTDVFERLGIFMNSVTALNNETQEQLEDIANDQHLGINAVIETTCKWATTMNSLAGTFINSYKQCLSSSERSSIDLMSNVSNALTQYICKDNGRRVSAFLAADGEDCIESAVIGVENCISRSFSENNTIVERSDSPIIPGWNDLVITINSQFCREFQNAQRCTVGVFRGCENPTTSYEVNALLNIVKQTIGCEDLLKI